MIKVDYSAIVNTAIKAIVVSIILGIVTGAVAIVWNIVWTGVTTVDKRIGDTETRITSGIEILVDEISDLRDEVEDLRDELASKGQVVSYEMQTIDTTAVLPVPKLTVPNQQRIMNRIDTKQMQLK